MKDKIKIAHVVGGLSGGGVEAVIYNHFSHMDLDKFEVHVISNSPSVKECEEQFKNLGFIIHVLPERRKNLKKNLSETVKIFKENRFDILHVHMNLNCFYHTFLGLICGIPVRIAHSHLVEFPEGAINKGVARVRKFLTRLTANRYFACGEEAAVYLFGKMNMDRGRVHILKNAIEPERFEFNKEYRKTIREELNISDDCLCFGNIGRFTEQKNQMFLLDVFKEILEKEDNCRLLLFGKGELENDLRGKAEHLGIKDKVVFMGVKNDIHRYYNAMDAFLFPSVYEGLGIVLVEAQTSGLKSFASSAVPKEVKLSNLVEFISLKKDSKYWAGKILKGFSEPALDRIHDSNGNLWKDYVINAGYDIKESAKELENYYSLECRKNRKNKKVK